MKPHSIDISEKAGIRYLHFGSRWVQGAMRIKRPFDLELAYAQDMLLGLLLRARTADTLTTGWPRNVLQIGLGAGSLVKWCHHYLPACKITAVEINPGVYAAARQFFRLPANDDRLDVSLEDGVAYLHNSSTAWDLILLDGYDAEGRPGALDSEDFYRLCRRKLAPEGLLSINLLGLARTYESSLARIHSAFDHQTTILPACNSGNRVVLAAAGPTPDIPPDIQARAAALKTATRLDLGPLLQRMGLAGNQAR